MSGEVAAQFELGLAPSGWDSLAQTAKGDGKTLDLMAKAGLVARKDTGRVYDRFRSRIIFPIHDYKGRVVAFGGRILGDGEPKYLNSPETPVFQKRSELYNLHRARSNIAQQGHSIVVEGYMDVVALAQHGVENAVATLGTATTPRHLERLFRLSPSIIFCFDGDRAGRAAAWRALETALPELGGGRQISFLFLPDGDDPDSLVRREGGDTFRDLASKAASLPDFLFEKLAGETDMDRIDGRARLVELAKPLLARLPEGPLRELMHQRLREETGVQSTETPRAARGRQVPSRRPTPSQRLSPIATAISLLLQQPGLATQFALPENLDDSADEPGLQLLIMLHKMAGAESHLTTGALLERFRDSEDASSLEKLAGKDHLLGEEDFPPFFSETLLTIREQALGKSIDELVARAGQEELDETSKTRLAELYRDRQLLREQREELGK